MALSRVYTTKRVVTAPSLTIWVMLPHTPHLCTSISLTMSSSCLLVCPSGTKKDNKEGKMTVTTQAMWTEDMVALVLFLPFLVQLIPQASFPFISTYTNGK